MTKTRWIAVAIIFLSSVMMIACSSTTTSPADNTQKPTTPAPKKEPVLYTGKSCLSQMAGMAGRWQPDAVPFHMESGLNAESNGHDGKSTIWRGMFASPSRRTYKVFTCSGSRLRDEAAMGVTSTGETAYGPTVPALMFQSFLLTTDSDKAYALAQQNGGARLLEKDPQQPVMYTLDWNAKQKQLLWVVVYGTSPNQAKGINEAKGIGVIDASTGRFLRAAK
jgi:hypothetical protein